jgi:hypothetical protein
MRTLFFVAIICCSLAGCSTQDAGPDYSRTKPGYYGGDGSSQEQAVIAVGIDQSAYAWIAQKYPGSTVLDQALVVPPGKKRYDVYGVRLRNGKVIQVWFLISGGIDALIR